MAVVTAVAVGTRRVCHRVLRFPISELYLLWITLECRDPVSRTITEVKRLPFSLGISPTYCTDYRCDPYPPTPDHKPGGTECEPTGPEGDDLGRPSPRPL